MSNPSTNPIWRWVAAVLLTGFILTAAVAASTRAMNRQEIGTALRKDQQEVARAILERVTLYQYGLRGMRGAVGGAVEGKAADHRDGEPHRPPVDRR